MIPIAEGGDLGGRGEIMRRAQVAGWRRAETDCIGAQMRSCAVLFFKDAGGKRSDRWN